MPHHLRFAAIMLALSLALGPSLAHPAAAADPADATRGKDFAVKMCTGCHAVLPGEPASPVHTAPSFTAVANTPGMNAMALNAWFHTSHPKMPNFIIATRDVEDVTAYILSLKDKK